MLSFAIKSDCAILKVKIVTQKFEAGIDCSRINATLLTRLKSGKESFKHEFKTLAFGNKSPIQLYAEM